MRCEAGRGLGGSSRLRSKSVAAGAARCPFPPSKVHRWGVSDFQKLHVWHKAHALSLGVHRAAKSIRGSDYASLRSQMIRAASSVPTNIVEGCGQEKRREFGRFLGYALNSSSELEYHLITARDYGVMTKEAFTTLAGQTVEVRKMLLALTKRVTAGEARDARKQPP